MFREKSIKFFYERAVVRTICLDELEQFVCLEILSRENIGHTAHTECT